MIEAVEQRIRKLKNAEHKPLFNSVESAMNLSSIKNRSVPKPYCAYVANMGETPVTLENDSAGSVTQMKVTLGVIMGIQSRNDPTGQRGNSLIKAAQEVLRQSLLGWRPIRAYRPFEIAASAPFAFADNGIWWIERYTTTYYLESLYDQTN